ncbi:MAG: pyruvate:ferredoxin (flavodoxin) oxidoreductase [Phycisphaeraceae bacterium]
MATRNARNMTTIDGNEATASVAYRLTETIVIYPITPSSNMGELADEWASRGRHNIWGIAPDVVEMQSEAGAIGSVHGALQAGSLSTTFTASQGLLLMIPNLYKIAGELTPFVIHVAARTLATHALSIFGDHSDVMACRQTGVAMLASASVQEAHDMATISHAATFHARLPIMHFFDGFRTSHEVSKIEELTDDDLRQMIDEEKIAEHRRRALTPDAPVLRGTAQNPDTFFQAREAANGFYDACPQIVQTAMDRFAGLTGRQYKLFDYSGAPDAERVIIIMGSGAQTCDDTAAALAAKGEKVGVVTVRLYRPFAAEAFISTLPTTVKKISVLDRTKEPGAVGEPLYQDVLAAIHESAAAGTLPFAVPAIVGGRYGLSSKEFTPAMVKAVFDNLSADKSRNHFTVGITDDVTHLSLPVDESFDIEPKDVVRAVFFGLGADGTVGANKNSIKIIGEDTPNYAQGYFVYDSKKSGAMTISHLRFGPKPIRQPYLIKQAEFVACHHWPFLDQLDVLAYTKPGGVLLLNAPFEAGEVWDQLPRQVQQTIIERKLRVFVIDAYTVAGATGMGRRINTIMQTCFFAISGVLPREEAIEQIKKAISKTYGKKGADVVRRNCEAVDQTLANMHQIDVPAQATAARERASIFSDLAPDFVKRVTGVMASGNGDLLPVSAFPIDGTWPTATSQWEKRGIAMEIPIWEPELCIQCNKCALVCPHAAIRAKVFNGEAPAGAPDAFTTAAYKAPDFKGLKYRIQVAPEDCTGCNLCVNICPAKDKSNARRKAINMAPLTEHRQVERENYRYFLDIPDVDRSKIIRVDVKGSQLMLPLFEYSGACAGCGETPYIKLMTQLFGDRALIANATGCSSIYGGNLPTTPYCVNAEGRGPAWCNSLFEDNAEFGLGMRLAVDHMTAQARQLLVRLAPQVGDELTSALLDGGDHEAASNNGDGHPDQKLAEQRQRVLALRGKLKGIDSLEARRLTLLADYLVKKSVWLFGGDGWAYDIGYGGLDHVMSMRRNINILVMDTEVYSNTGGQASKATPLGASAKFATSGKTTQKKDLGLMAMSYGHVYVASIAMGASDAQTVKAFLEAESYPGPSLIIAYSHCIAHGYDLAMGMDQQRRAVACGIWPLYRYDPRRAEQGLPPLQLDARPPKVPVSEYLGNETRFRMVEKIDPDRFKRLAIESQRQALQRVALYQQLAQLAVPTDPKLEAEPAKAAVAADNN